jgi:hypothetical protein
MKLLLYTEQGDFTLKNRYLLTDYCWTFLGSSLGSFLGATSLEEFRKSECSSGDEFELFDFLLQLESPFRKYLAFVFVFIVSGLHFLFVLEFMLIGDYGRLFAV